MNENDNRSDGDCVAGVHDRHQSRQEADAMNLSCGKCKAIQVFKKSGPGLAYSCTDCGWFLGTPAERVTDTELETLRFELRQLSTALNQIYSHLNQGHIVEIVRHLDFAKERVEKLREVVK